MRDLSVAADLGFRSLGRFPPPGPPRLARRHLRLSNLAGRRGRRTAGLLTRPRPGVATGRPQPASRHPGGNWRRAPCFRPQPTARALKSWQPLDRRRFLRLPNTPGYRSPNRSPEWSALFLWSALPTTAFSRRPGEGLGLRCATHAAERSPPHGGGRLSIRRLAAAAASPLALSPSPPSPRRTRRGYPSQETPRTRRKRGTPAVTDGTEGEGGMREGG